MPAPNSVAFLARLGVTHPIIQAPMAGTSTPALAAAVSNAGGLGSLGLGASTPGKARESILELRHLTTRPFNVNVFAHQPGAADRQKEGAWLKHLGPRFESYGSQTPMEVKEIYKSFLEDDEMVDVLLEIKPPVVSFHFGIPCTSVLAKLKAAGSILLASATNPIEAKEIEEAGLDGIIAQGYEAGGHRGMFDPVLQDDELSTFALTTILLKERELPIISAGGIMDGAGIAAYLRLGACAVQLGTAFILCPESAADQGFRLALKGPGASHTRMTRIISGRPARCLRNKWTDVEETLDGKVPPAYPMAYDAGKALHAAAKGAGEEGYGAHWAGQGAPLARAMGAAELVRTLVSEIRVANG